MNRITYIAFIVALLISVNVQAQNDPRLESIITGNQEQPQVLYLVPWQTPNSPTLKYDVINNQSAVVFEHLERSELLRELKYLPPLAAPAVAEVTPTQQSTTKTTIPKTSNETTKQATP